MFWVDPILIQYVEKAAENLSKVLTVLIVIFGSHKQVEELRRALYDNSSWLEVVGNRHKKLQFRYW